MRVFSYVYFKLNKNGGSGPLFGRNGSGRKIHAGRFDSFAAHVDVNTQFIYEKKRQSKATGLVLHETGCGGEWDL